MVHIPFSLSPICISSLSYHSNQIPSKKPVKGGQVYFAQVIWAVIENTWQRMISFRHWEFGAWIPTSQEIRNQRGSLTTGVRKLVVQHSTSLRCTWLSKGSIIFQRVLPSGDVFFQTHKFGEAKHIPLPNGWYVTVSLRLLRLVAIAFALPLLLAFQCLFYK